MKEIINGKYGQYTVYDRCIAVGYHFFNTIEEVEKYKYFRICNKLKPMDNVLDEAVKIMKINKRK